VQFLFAGHTLDTDRRELRRRDSQSIAVEPQVFDLLTYLDPMIAGPEGGPSSDMQRFED
jgi:hypothetical protein